MVYRVTEVTYGQGPSQGDLQYQPPVKPVQEGPLSFLPFGLEAIGPLTTYQAPPPFFSVRPPTSSTKLAIIESVGARGNGAGVQSKTDWVNILFGHDRYVETYYDEYDAWGTGRYYKSPYLVVQERIQAHGLPIGLQVATVGLARGTALPSGADLGATTAGRTAAAGAESASVPRTADRTRVGRSTALAQSLTFGSIAGTLLSSGRIVTEH